MAKRYWYLDTIRGITLISMILFHGSWDAVFLGNLNWPWYLGNGAYIWQQTICWTFIFLSGFCYSFGLEKPIQAGLKRGLTVFGAGLIITLVTLIVMPDERIVFGVLTLLGSCMLLLLPIRKLLAKIPIPVGFCIGMIAFFVTREINNGYLGFEGIHLCKLPVRLYQMGYLMTYLGFTDWSFFSSDYFSLIPWIFLFIAGIFSGRAAKKCGVLDKLNELSDRSIIAIQRVLTPVTFLGKHSLWVYMLHQPILYVLVVLLPGMFR